MFNLSKDEITFEVVKNFCREWPEGVCVEYKQEIKDIPKIVSSFANTQGGIYIIGVKANQTDNKVVFPIEGILDAVGIEERITQSAYEGIYPPVIPEVIKIDVRESGNVVIIVRVDESANAPHAIQNSTRVYIRVGSVTQPYQKPELAEIDRIEYLLKRRQNTKGVVQQVLHRIENRMERFFNMNAPIMKLIARPVFVYRPITSPAAICGLYLAYNHIKRVPGGVCHFLEPSHRNNQLSNNYFELNQYGIVYYATSLYESEEGISTHQFVDGISELLKHAQGLYGECDTFVNIEVSVELKNVLEQKLSNNLGRGSTIPIYADLVCYDSEVFASTSKTYLSRDLNDSAHQKAIFEELILQLLWAFNIPSNEEYIIKCVREVIALRIGE